MDTLVVQLGFFVVIFLGVNLYKLFMWQRNRVSERKRDMSLDYRISNTSFRPKRNNFVILFLVSFGYSGTVATIFQSSLTLSLMIATVGGVSNIICSL